jgi:thiosulfate/3-mercaptopyruvate sulfurtransferase
MKHRTLIAALVCLVLAVMAPANATGSEAGSKLLVQTSWLAAHLNDSNVGVLHVAPNRTSYDAGHISGARFLPLSDVAVTRNGIPNQLPAVDVMKAAFERVGIGDKSRVVIYGDISGLFAARVYFALDYLGHGTHAALLDGGLERWKAEHRDLSTTAPAFKVVSLTVKARPELVVGLPAMKQMVADKKTTLIDARPPNEYSGATAGDGVPRGGHIPGARNVFWMENLASKDNPILKPAPEMLAKYEAAGVKRGKKLVVYCRTGVQASHDYFTLKLLGFSPVLYEGSFFEWSNTPGTPVEISKP